MNKDTPQSDMQGSISDIEAFAFAPQSNTDWRELVREYYPNGLYARLVKTGEYVDTTDTVFHLISQLLEAEEKRWREEVEKQIRALPSFTDCDNHLDRDEVLQKLS